MPDMPIRTNMSRKKTTNRMIFRTMMTTSSLFLRKKKGTDYEIRTFQILVLLWCYIGIGYGFRTVSKLWKIILRLLDVYILEFHVDRNVNLRNRTGNVDLPIIRCVYRHSGTI